MKKIILAITILFSFCTTGEAFSLEIYDYKEPYSFVANKNDKVDFYIKAKNIRYNNQTVISTDPFSYEILDNNFEVLDTDKYQHLYKYIFYGSIASTESYFGIQTLIFEKLFPEYIFNVGYYSGINNVALFTYYKNDYKNIGNNITMPNNKDINIFTDDNYDYRSLYNKHFISRINNESIEEYYDIGSHNLEYEFNEKYFNNDITVIRNEHGQEFIITGNIPIVNKTINVKKSEITINSYSSIMTNFNYELYLDGKKINDINTRDTSVKLEISKSGEYCLKSTINELVVSEDTSCLNINADTIDPTFNFTYRLDYLNVDIKVYKEDYDYKDEINYYYKEVDDFILYASTDIIINETILYKKDDVVDLDRIVKGSYYIRYLDNRFDFLVESDDNKYFYVDIEKYNIKLKYLDEQKKPIHHTIVLNSEKINIKGETDMLGVIEIKDVPSGLYKMEELSANNHFNNSFQVIELNKDIEILIEKQVAFGEINVRILKEKYVILDNKYHFIDELQRNIHINILDESNMIVDTLITNEFGEAKSKLLSVGKYSLKCDDELFNKSLVNELISINKDTIIYNIEVQTKIDKGRLEIIQTDSNNIYELSESNSINNKILIKDKIEDIPYGKYIMKNDEEKKKITIDKKNNNVVVEQEDTYEYKELKNNYYYLIILPIIGASIYIIKRFL